MNSHFRGISAAPGVGIGAAVLHRTGHFTLEESGAPELSDPVREWQRFRLAQRQVDEELERLGRNSSSLVKEVFAAHRLILQDQTLEDSVRNGIEHAGLSAAAATFQAVSELAEIMRGLDDEYFSGRSSDVLDIGQRLLAQLGAGVRRPRLDTLPAGTILIADDLTPSDVAQLQPEQVQGIALAGGAPTAHAAILARSLGIPLVCGLGNEILRTPPRRPAIVDADSGILIISPNAESVRRYHAARQSQIEERALAARHAHEPALTRDGVRIAVLANANSPEDVLAVRNSGAEGIGLLRTEYLYQGRSTPPTLEEQSEAYGCFLLQVEPGQLTVRALDAGGDKPIAYVAHPREENPFLGLRGIRLLLEQPELLHTQIRALLLAAAAKPAAAEVRFLLPMISTVEEIQAVRAIAAQERASLPAGHPARSAVLKLGAMIETPSAALIAHQLAPLVDFFSIGTNDLAQYTLASDRTNRTVGMLADPLHPSVLRLIQMTCDAGNAAGIPVALCGELAGNLAATPLLLGLGVHELSAPLPAVALVKATVRRHSLEKCRALAQRALACSTAACVRDLLQ